MKKYAQSKLDSQKGYFFFLWRYKNFSINKLATTFEVGRSTVWRYLKSPEFEEIKTLIIDNKPLMEMNRYLGENQELLDAYTVFNTRNRSDIQQSILDKYPNVPFVFQDSSGIT